MTDGVMFRPSRLAITSGRPYALRAATTELVVPRSIPTKVGMGLFRRGLVAVDREQDLADPGAERSAPASLLVRVVGVEEADELVHRQEREARLGLGHGIGAVGLEEHDRQRSRRRYRQSSGTPMPA